MRQAYDYWQDQPGSCLWPGPGSKPPGRSIKQFAPRCRGGSQFGRRSALPCFGPTPPPPGKAEGGRRLFLESPLSVPPPPSNESETHPATASKRQPAGGFPQEEAQRQPAEAAKGPKGPSTPRPFWQPASWYACTSCIGTSSPSAIATLAFGSRGAMRSPPIVSNRRPALRESVGWPIHLPLAAAGGLSTPRLTVPHRPTGTPPLVGGTVAGESRREGQPRANLNSSPHQPGTQAVTARSRRT